MAFAQPRPAIELLAGGLDQTLVAGDERRGLEDLLGGVVGVHGLALEGDRDGLEGRLDVGERRLAVLRRRRRRQLDPDEGKTCTTAGPYADPG